jgi:hypothetical protein
MENLEKQQERREHQRVLAKDWIFAVCKSHAVKIGRVVDIGRGGLAFHYVPDSDSARDLIEGPLNLEIFETRSSCCLKGVAGKIVYNREVSRPANLPATYPLMHCGVEFDELSTEQHFQLDFIIHNFTLQES